MDTFTSLDADVSELLDGYATPWDAAVASFLALLDERGAARRSGDRLTVAEHSLQVADLAARAGAAPALVAAALLHDLGHLMPDPVESLGAARDSGHEQIAAALLHPWFPEAVVEPVRLHVAAKRWLCATEPEHAALMTQASRASLGPQGGGMTDEEAALFTAGPWHADAVQLRRWDDRANQGGRCVPGVDGYLELLTALAHEHQAHRAELQAARTRIDAATAA